MTATDWTALVKDLAKSVVPIERDGVGTNCTGFIINAHVKKDDQDLDYVLSVGHCDDAKVWVDQSAPKVVSKTSNKDLIVWSIEDTGRPALKLAHENPKVGEEVASLGYGLALDQPLFRVAHISAETHIPYEGIGGPLFFIDGAFVGGQSGGPVINAAGEVVMIVQMKTESVGIGVGAEVLKARVGRYWEKPQAKP